MKNPKFTMILAGSLILALALATAAGAQQRRLGSAGLQDDAAGGFGIRQFVNNLQLSETQRADIRAILKAHQPEILAARIDLLKARIGLLNKDPKAPGDFGAANARIAELKLTIGSQIEAKLTAEQLSILKNRQQRQADLLSRRLQRLEEREIN
jgi:hypothetical protein